jgi:hypothetical protein
MFVYVAGPITKGDQAVNVRRAMDVGSELLAAGHMPFVPHLTWFWHLVTFTDYEQWMAYDFEWIKRCDALLRIPGDSPGADREVEHATRLGLLVVHGTAADFIARVGAAS